MSRCRHVWGRGEYGAKCIYCETVNEKLLPPSLRTKPAPDLFHAAVAQVGGTDAVVVGDSVWDTQAARAAGLPCLAVRTGGFDDAELLANGATAVYEQLIGPRPA